MSHLTGIIDNEGQGTYFISQFGLYGPDNNTTPLRVIFDASCPTTNVNFIECITL